MAEPVSVVVCTRNEAHRIERLIASVPFADEVLVLDCGSTDETVAVARAAGARVERQEWLGFSSQKNAAARLAQYDWILSLDADEIVAPALAQSITHALGKGPDPDTAFAVDRRGDFRGRVLPNTLRRSTRRRYVRLYHRDRSHWDETTALHEFVVTPGQIEMLDGQLLHWNDLTMSELLAMFNRYASAEAAEMEAAGKRVRAIEVVARPVARFLWTYIAMGEWRLGGHGLVHSGLKGVHDYMRYAQLWERQHARLPTDGEPVGPADWGRDTRDSATTHPPE